MVECPKCHGSIEIGETNFGTLFTCSLCSGLFFVGWDGQPELNDQVEIPADAHVSFPPDLISESVSTLASEPASEPIVEPATASEQARPWGTLDQEFGGSVMPQTPVSAIQEIERYANQNQEATPLSYDLTIRGLDLPKQIQFLREVLQDSRFGWNSEELISQINQGVLVLRNLSPIKASALVQRVKYSDLEIGWRQNVLS